MIQKDDQSLIALTGAPTGQDVATLGQVFTPAEVVECMLGLRKNAGRVLEPSCGDGAFFNKIAHCVGIELDRRHAPPHSLNIDFFSYPLSEQFDTIIGNPPYVRYQNIEPATKRQLNSDLFDLRSNLYLFFIEKCIRHLNKHGELIFITPRDFLKSTASVKLNQWLFQQGTITHALELGDAKVFADALPNCLIWRFEKGNFCRNVAYAQVGIRDDWRACIKQVNWQSRYFKEYAGQLMFVRETDGVRLGDFATVKVGAVSGDDEIFANETQGTLDFIYSATATTGKTRKMVWVDPDQEIPPYLLQHKQRLINRKIRPFNESNWWQWGRGFPRTEAPRIYVNVKTRASNPFFTHPCLNFDGAVLAIFPTETTINIEQFCQAMNQVAWAELGFMCDGRYLFTQRTLENALVPASLFRPMRMIPTIANDADNANNTDVSFKLSC